MLIQNQSQPDKESWNQMQGRMLGEYESRERAERALKQKDGTFSTSDGDQELEKNERLNASVCNEDQTSIPRKSSGKLSAVCNLNDVDTLLFYFGKQLCDNKIECILGLSEYVSKFILFGPYGL